MVKNGGQVSTEFIILFALLILFLVPLSYLILQSTLESTEQVSYARINAVFSEVANEAREVYFRGPQSRIVVSVNIPRNVKEVQILKAVPHDSDLPYRYFFRIEFFAERQDQVSIIPIEAPINTTNLVPSGDSVQCNNHDCTVYILPDFEKEGLKHIQIRNSYVGSDLMVTFELLERVQ